MVRVPRMSRFMQELQGQRYRRVRVSQIFRYDVTKPAAADSPEELEILDQINGGVACAGGRHEAEGHEEHDAHHGQLKKCAFTSA